MNKEEDRTAHHHDGKKKRRTKKESKQTQGEGLKQTPRGYGERKVLSELPKVDSLTFGEVLGFGHFSHVYSGVYKHKYQAAIKIIERGSRRLVAKEIDLLKKLRGLPHIIQLYEVMDLEETTLLVFERAESMSTDEFYSKLTLSNFRVTLRRLITALLSAHEKGIVHRDVKLGNIMISPDFSDLKLIDWGCGAPIKEKMSSKAGSRTCRSIEMLLGFEGYESAGDMWSVGAFIYTVLCGGKLPWRMPNSWQTVVALSAYFGRRNTLELAENLGCEIPDDVVEAIKAETPTRLSVNYSQDMKSLQNRELIDLMHHLLDINYETRYSAEEALEHPFFDQEGDDYEYEYEYEDQ